MNLFEGAKTQPGFWYVASPYTKYVDGFDAAYEDVCEATAHLTRHGLSTFSPIAHGHGLAVHGRLSFTDPKLWAAIDAPFVAAAVGIIVCKMPGWATSHGVTEEIKAFRSTGRPVLQMPWPFDPAAAPLLEPFEAAH